MRGFLITSSLVTGSKSLASEARVQGMVEGFRATPNRTSVALSVASLARTSGGVLGFLATCVRYALLAVGG